jgi:large subunit ribosomal protein L4
MNAAALRSALSAKVAADQIVVVDAFSFDAPKTKAMVQALRVLGVNNDSALLVMQDKSTAVIRSASNLPNVKTILSGYINIRDLLGYDKVLLSKDALEHIELWLTPANLIVDDEEIDGADDAGSAPEGTEA